MATLILSLELTVADGPRADVVREASRLAEGCADICEGLIIGTNISGRDSGGDWKLSWGVWSMSQRAFDTYVSEPGALGNDAIPFDPPGSVTFTLKEVRALLYPTYQRTTRGTGDYHKARVKLMQAEDELSK